MLLKKKIINKISKIKTFYFTRGIYIEDEFNPFSSVCDNCALDSYWTCSPYQKAVCVFINRKLKNCWRYYVMQEKKDNIP